MRTRVTVLCLLVCLSACYQSPGFFSRLYEKLDIPACSSLVLLGFKQISIKLFRSFLFFGAFHGYFVVSSPYNRTPYTTCGYNLTVTWSDTPAPHAHYYFCQLSTFDRSQIVNGGAAALAQLTPLIWTVAAKRLAGKRQYL